MTPLDALQGDGRGRDPALERLARIAQLACKTPVVVVALDDGRWLRLAVTIGVAAPPESARVPFRPLLAGSHATFVEDASRDARLAGHPLLSLAPDLRFGARAPLSLDGVAVGELIVADRRPRTPPSAELEALGDVAAQVSSWFSLRLHARAVEPHQALGALGERLRDAQDRRDAHRRRFQELLDLVTDGIFILDRSERCLEANRAALASTRRTREEVIGRLMPEVFPESSQYSRAVLRAFATGETVVEELRYAPLDLYTEVHCYPGRDRAVVLFSDVTERQRRLAALADSRELLRSVVAQLPDGVVVFDPELRARFVNPAAWRLLGYESPPEPPPSPAGLQALLRMRLPDGSLVPEAQMPGARAIRGEEVRDFRGFVTDARHRTRAISRDASPFRRPDGSVRGAVVTLRDVTETVELDRLKDEFLSVAAHELKTPVAVIKTYAQLLLPGGEAGGVIAGLLRGVERIDAMVTDLLEISQLDLGRLRLHTAPLALDELVARVVQRAGESSAERRVSLQPCEPVRVEADPTRLGRVLEQLISNALKFSSGEVQVALHAVGDEAVVSVRDRGVGIPLERQPRIFERFYRAHTDTPDDRGGIGLGLYLARELVQRQGGRIWFESEEGRGSTFSFALPRR